MNVISKFLIYSLLFLIQPIIGSEEIIINGLDHLHASKHINCFYITNQHDLQILTQKIKDELIKSIGYSSDSDGIHYTEKQQNFNSKNKIFLYKAKVIHETYHLYEPWTSGENGDQGYYLQDDQRKYSCQIIASANLFKELKEQQSSCSIS